MADSENKKKKKQISLGVLFWIAFILLFIVIFLLNRNTIVPLVQKFNSVVRNEAGEEPPPAPSAPHTPEITRAADESAFEPVEPPPAQSAPSAGASEDVSAPSASKETRVSSGNGESAASKPETKTEANSESSAAPAVQYREAAIYFVSIDGDGVVNRQKVSRSLPRTDSPLVDTINELLRGPAAEETRKGYLSLIPENSKLLSASVKSNGVAALNFNDAFQFNTYGIDGCIAQLMQIVFTATEFPTVSSVQFLIDGQRKDFLGVEGVRISVPLSRASF